MHTSKPIDLPLLEQELVLAGVVVTAIMHQGTADDGELYAHDPETGEIVDLPPEARPVVDAHDASTPQRVLTFAAQEDEERLRLVAERSRTDPAFAALAELALRGAQTP